MQIHAIINENFLKSIKKKIKTENLWIKIKSLNTQENIIKTTMQQDFNNKKKLNEETLTKSSQEHLFFDTQYKQVE